MVSVVGILGALGGVAAFIGLLAVMVRGLFSQIHAIEDNTRALNDLRLQLQTVDGRADEFERRISRLEGKAGA
jgi:hypothetical protein